jgi:N-acetyltransferase
MLIPDTVTLENDRVLLRPLQTNDLQYLASFAINEPEIWHFSTILVQGEEGMKDYIDAAVTGRVEGHSFPFIVFDKQTNEYAGCTRFYDIQPINKSLQLGYTWYGKNFQRTGLNRNCKFLLLQYVFEELKFERVEFRADNNNQRSIAAMKAIGCVPEGVLRSHMLLPNCTRRDSIILSILKREWKNGGKEKLQELIR